MRVCTVTLLFSSLANQALGKPVNEKIHLSDAVKSDGLRQAYKDICKDPDALKQLVLAADTINEEKKYISDQGGKELRNSDACHTLNSLDQAVCLFLPLCVENTYAVQLCELYTRTRVSIVVFAAREVPGDIFKPQTIGYGRLVQYFPNIMRQTASNILVTMDGYALKEMQGKKIVSLIEKPLTGLT